MWHTWKVALKPTGQVITITTSVLAKVDQGMIPAHRIEMDIRSNSNVTRSSSGGLYGELSQLDRLRKEGLITDQEFQMRKQKVLNR